MNQLITKDVISIDTVEAEAKAFELAQRKAAIYSQSTLVPKHYQGKGNIGNVLIAENMAVRMGADPLMVMQNLYVVHGNPGWSSKFLIACFNTCGRFSVIKYKFTGEKGKQSWGCIAYATEIESGDVIEGTEITIAMAKAEGWSEKNGSKWKTMPEQMLRYRAAAFLIRTTAPEIGMGLMTSEELSDTGGKVVAAVAPTGNSLEALTDRLEGNDKPEPEADPKQEEAEQAQYLDLQRAALEEAKTQAEAHEAYERVTAEIESSDKFDDEAKKWMTGQIEDLMEAVIERVKG